MKIFGVEFAPISVPLERRLQTLAVLNFTLCFVVYHIFFSLLTIYTIFFTSYYWLVLGYLVWWAYDVFVAKTHEHGGRRSEWLRTSSHIKYFRDYFPIELVKTSDLDPSRNYLFGCHPHGIMSCSLFCNFASEVTGFMEKFPGIKATMLTLNVNFMWPVLRGYVSMMGLCGVSRDSVKWLLTQQGVGNAVIIVIGGAQEALDACPGTYKLTLKNRKGFVKIAIQNGASLVPVFSFGENDLYEQAENPKGSKLRKFQETFKNIFGFSPPLFYGRGIFNYSFGLLPRRLPIHTVVGRPIDVAKEPNPSRELVEEMHQKYMDELSKLFEEHKLKYGVKKETTLEFI